MNGQALYLFCFASTGSLREASREHSELDGDIVALSVEEVTALISAVPLEDFEGPDAETRLQDISWVGPRALRHGEVISHIMQWSPVLPARFGTLFSSEQTLLDLIRRNYDTIRAFLERARDSEEWSVKVLFSKSEATEALFRDMLEEHSQDLAAKQPGLRYFKERQIRGHAEKEIGSWLKTVCGKVSEALRICSRDSVKRPLGTLSVDPEGKEIVLNWAFLVGSDRGQELCSVVERANSEFRERGLVFQISGPWPPYSFCPPLMLEEAES